MKFKLINLFINYVYDNFETFHMDTFCNACCHYHLFRLANPVKRERHHMGAVENVFISAATGDRGDLASVEADGHLVSDLRL